MIGDRFATRLNSFASGAEAYWPDLVGKPSVMQMVERAATVQGLTDVELNHPTQVGNDPAAEAGRVRDLGLEVHGLAMRYYGDPAYRMGAFTNPDPAVRRRAIDLTRRAVDAAGAMGARRLTIWPGQDGWETAFQVDHDALWAWEVEAIAAVAAHDPLCEVSLEYKPDEPRARAVLPDAATTLLAIAEAGASNLGVTLDFAHSLYAGEDPARAAVLIHRHSRLIGVHLNDGHGRRDDGLMVGAVHLHATVDLLGRLLAMGHEGALYFDTFPDATGMDPVAEADANVETTRALIALARRIEDDPRLGEARAAQDAIAAQRLAMEHIMARP